jgi:glycine cleavage system H protein
MASSQVPAQRRRHLTRAATAATTAPIGADHRRRSDMSDLEYPSDLRYTSDHEWVRVGDDGVVRIGITSFAQDALGDVVYVSLPAVGDSVAAGDSCGEVESTKSVSDVYAPLDGEVTATNAALDASPELINSDPYGEGWMFELRLADASSVEGLMDASTYTASLS